MWHSFCGTGWDGYGETRKHGRHGPKGLGSHKSSLNQASPISQTLVEGGLAWASVFWCSKSSMPLKPRQSHQLQSPTGCMTSKCQAMRRRMGRLPGRCTSGRAQLVADSGTCMGQPDALVRGLVCDSLGRPASQPATLPWLLAPPESPDE